MVGHVTGALAGDGESASGSARTLLVREERARRGLADLYRLDIQSSGDIISLSRVKIRTGESAAAYCGRELESTLMGTQVGLSLISRMNVELPPASLSVHGWNKEG